MPFRRLIPLAAAVLLLAIAGCGSEGGDGSSPGGDSASGGSETEQVKVFTTEGEQFDPVQKEVPAGDLPKAATQALLDASDAPLKALNELVKPSEHFLDHQQMLLHLSSKL